MEMQCSGINIIRLHIPPSKSKRKEAHTQIYKHSRKTRSANRTNSSFTKQVVIKLPSLKTAVSLFYLFSFLNSKTEPNKKPNGSCYSGGHSAEDHIRSYSKNCLVATCVNKQVPAEKNCGLFN